MGRVAAPHGVRGAVRIKPYSGEAVALLEHDAWWIRHGRRGWMRFAVRGGREQGAMLVAELAGVESREAAAALRGAEVGVPRDAMPALGENEHYEADLIGMAVVNRSGEVLGTVGGFLASGAHPIMRVAGDGGAERLIPWVAQYIDRVDALARRIGVDWPLDY